MNVRMYRWALGQIFTVFTCFVSLISCLQWLEKEDIPGTINGVPMNLGEVFAYGSGDHVPDRKTPDYDDAWKLGSLYVAHKKSLLRELEMAYNFEQRVRQEVASQEHQEQRAGAAEERSHVLTQRVKKGGLGNTMSSFQLIDPPCLSGQISNEEQQTRNVKRLRQDGIEFSPKKKDVEKYKRHQTVRLEDEKIKKRKRNLEFRERLNDEAIKRLAASEVLLTEASGYLEAEGDEKTWKFQQKDILKQLDNDSCVKAFDLNLSFGPYVVDFTKNGRYLLSGGRKGALSIIDCMTFQAVTETNVRETIRSVCFLHNETMWAAAQKKYVHIYDKSGLELHCLRDHMLTYAMEFLPYHYLLTTIGEFGELRYLDVSTGMISAAHKTRKGPCTVMCQNPSNAMIQLGHGSGAVTLWTPNVGKPIVEFLAHGGKVTAMQCVKEHYFATAGLDGTWKIWDMRKFDTLHHYNYFGTAPTTITTSQTGLIGIGFGPHIQIWKDTCRESKIKAPYMRHDMNGCHIQSLKFRPFEDFMAIGSSKGIHSIVIPGSCMANYDSFSGDPYETRKQRQEHEVHSLLEKLPATTITYDPQRLGMLDEAPQTLILEERNEEKNRIIELKANRGRKKKKKVGAAAQRVTDQKKYGELKKQLAQKRQLEERLTERGKEQKESVEQIDDEKAEKNDEAENTDNEFEQKSKTKKSTNALDRFKNRERAHYTA